MSGIRIYNLAETAVTIEFDTAISTSANEKVLNTLNMLKQQPFIGFREAVPAFSSLTVYFDPLTISRYYPYCEEPVCRIVTSWLKQLIARFPETQNLNRPVSAIPVCYDTSFAPDIKMVAKHCGITPSQVVDLHSTNIYQVFFNGFIPGFPYLGISPETLDVPRKQTPALKVAAGSVAVAGRQSGIYPFETPGGWQIIGRTPITIFDKSANPSCKFKAGDRVRFVPISKSEFEKLSHS